MKLAIMGPSYPFKGGISHYTTTLSNKLKEKHQVTFYSFSRPYPKFLFPGDREDDNSKEIIRDLSVKKMIDWANPFSWIIAGIKIKNDKPDLLIVSWWMWGWAIPFWVICKLSKSKVLFICHNVVEHESANWKFILTKLVLSQGNYFLVHSKSDKNDLKKLFPNAKIILNFLPSFEFFNKTKISQKKARDKLKIKHKKIILFFGFVRTYKGLDILLKAMPKIIKEVPDLALIIAGEFWEDQSKYLDLIKKLNIEKSIYLFNGYIPNENVSNFFSAADLVVLPYRSGTGSGVTQASFAFNKPVLASNVGDFVEVVDNGRRGVVLRHNTPLMISKEVVKLFKSDKLLKYTNNIKRDKNLFSWENMIEKIEELFVHL